MATTEPSLEDRAREFVREQWDWDGSAFSVNAVVALLRSVDKAAATRATEAARAEVADTRAAAKVNAENFRRRIADLEARLREAERLAEYVDNLHTLILNAAPLTWAARQDLDAASQWEKRIKGALRVVPLAATPTAPVTPPWGPREACVELSTSGCNEGCPCCQHAQALARRALGEPAEDIEVEPVTPPEPTPDLATIQAAAHGMGQVSAMEDMAKMARALADKMQARGQTMCAYGARAVAMHIGIERDKCSPPRSSEPAPVTPMGEPRADDKEPPCRRCGKVTNRGATHYCKGPAEAPEPQSKAPPAPCPCGDQDRPGHPIAQWCEGGAKRRPEAAPPSVSADVPRGPRSVLESLRPKPRTTVKRFADELKARIAKVETAFNKPGQDLFVAGAAYVKGVIDAALSDYDVRDPEDFERVASGVRSASAEPTEETRRSGEKCGRIAPGDMKRRPCVLPAGHRTYCRTSSVDLGTKEQQLARLDRLGEEGHVGAGVDRLPAAPPAPSGRSPGSEAPFDARELAHDIGGVCVPPYPHDCASLCDRVTERIAAAYNRGLADRDAAVEELRARLRESESIARRFQAEAASFGAVNVRLVDDRDAAVSRARDIAERAANVLGFLAMCPSELCVHGNDGCLAWAFHEHAARNAKDVRDAIGRLSATTETPTPRETK